MAFHSHGEKPFEAQRVFTDREKPIALFEKAFAEGQERDDHRVICWHGVGGQGKSSLHDEIRRRIASNPDVALAGLDFDVPRHRRIEDAMLKLRGDLAGRGMSFPTFDLAFARHFALERPGENIREVHPQLYRRGESQIVDDMLDWSEAGVDMAVEGISLAVPGLNLLYKYGARLTGRLSDWWASRKVKEKLAGLDQLSTSELAERLPQYLGFDIWRAREEIGCPRIVITVDTHEKLGQGELRGDGWLQILVRETPGALILIFGRDKVRWAELDTRWEGVLDQHLLGELSDEDADHFLAQVPIPEEEIRARIVGSAEGLPHYLDLAVSFYEDIRNEGEMPKPEDFGTTPVEVRDRFLDHLPSEERRELILASYPESLSERLFLDLAGAFLGGAGSVNWTRLARRSFINEGPDGRLVMHALMREALQDQDRSERKELFEQIHQFLLDRYEVRAGVLNAKSVTSDAEVAFGKAVYHASRISFYQAKRWLQEHVGPFKQAASWFIIKSTITMVMKNGDEHPMQRCYMLEMLVPALEGLNMIEEAITAYTEIAETRETLIGPSSGAAAFGRLAILHERESPEKSDKLMERALWGHMKLLDGSHRAFLSGLALNASALASKGDGAAAEIFSDKYDRLAPIVLHEAHSTPSCAMRQAVHMNTVLTDLLDQKERWNCDFTYQMAIVLMSQIEAIDFFQSLAIRQHRAGLLEEAKELWTGILAVISSRPRGLARDEHMARALHGYADFLMDQCEYSEASEKFTEALQIGENIWGPLHPETISFLSGAARGQAVLGDVSRARGIIADAKIRAESCTTPIEAGARVGLTWAQALKEIGEIEEALVEAETARMLLASNGKSTSSLHSEARTFLAKSERAGVAASSGEEELK